MFGPVVKQMPFNDISTFSSGYYFVQRSKSLCNFGREHYEDHFCKIILNLGQWLMRCCLKFFYF